MSANGTVFQIQYAGGTWGTWVAINGGSAAIASDLDVAPVNGTQLEAFGLGTNKEIYESAYQSQTWSGWSSSTPGLTFRLGTAASAPSGGRLWLFAIGADAGLWARYLNAGAGWTDWNNLGGNCISSPDSTSRPARTWAVLRGGDSQLYMKTTDNNDQAGWGGYIPLPALAGGFSSGPCITSWSDTRIDVFARGETDSSLWHNYSDDAGATWAVGNNWENWGGGGTIAADAPDCVAWASGRIDIVARGIDGHIWHQPSSNGSPGVWQDLGVH